MNAKKTARSKRLLIIICTAVFIAVMTIWIGALAVKNTQLSNELEQKRQEATAIAEENAALEALVDEENETALMEEYARRAGYVYPDERVYINEN